MMIESSLLNLELPSTLSERDCLCLLMLATSTLDDRLALPHRQNCINFSGAIFDSSNVGTIENLSISMDEWSAEQLLDFASRMIEKVKELQ
jgi:hypothetical protein